MPFWTKIPHLLLAVLLRAVLPRAVLLPAVLLLAVLLHCSGAALQWCCLRSGAAGKDDVGIGAARKGCCWQMPLLSEMQLATLLLATMLLACAAAVKCCCW